MLTTHGRGWSALDTFNEMLASPTYDDTQCNTWEFYLLWVLLLMGARRIYCGRHAVVFILP